MRREESDRAFLGMQAKTTKSVIIDVKTHKQYTGTVSCRGLKHKKKHRPQDEGEHQLPQGRLPGRSKTKI